MQDTGILEAHWHLGPWFVLSLPQEGNQPSETASVIHPIANQLLKDHDRKESPHFMDYSSVPSSGRY